MQQSPPTLVTATADSEPSPSCGRAMGTRTLSARRIPAPMGSDATPPPCTVGELPLLRSISTIVVRDKPAAAEGAADDGAIAEECVTPKADVHVLKPPAVCPPAPRKPRPAKRGVTPSKNSQAVACDLESVFHILPPKKRIRVGWSIGSELC